MQDTSERKRTGGDRILIKRQDISHLTYKKIPRFARIRSLFSRTFRTSLSGKRYATHSFFFGIALFAAWQGQTVTSVDYGTLVYSSVFGDEVTEGPLDPSAYAQGEQAAVGGERLAAAASDPGLDIITFDDIEVGFSTTLFGGNAVVAPLDPTLGDEVADESGDVAKKSQIYTVESGDTISTIAEKFNISSDTIKSANGLGNSDVIKSGDHLTILSTNGVEHTVVRGDTVTGIAQTYDAEPDSIMSYNNLPDTAALRIGQKIIVPGGTLPAPRYIARTPEVTPEESTNSPEATPEPITKKGSGMVWPTTTRHMSQGYGFRGHTGIDIDNRNRPNIYVAEDGDVEFTGRLGGYGNLTIVKHAGGKQTYYAHQDKIYVKVGDTVRAGDAIGKMGSTGRSTGPHLHFEVRINGRPVNPLAYF